MEGNTTEEISLVVQSKGRMRWGNLPERESSPGSEPEGGALEGKELQEEPMEVLACQEM